jgi:hypothetical protein
MGTAARGKGPRPSSTARPAGTTRIGSSTSPSTTEWSLSESDADAVARYRAGPEDGSDVPFEAVYELADKAERYLNSQLVTGGWSFGWSDHEFLLANQAWWERDG